MDVAPRPLAFSANKETGLRDGRFFLPFAVTAGWPRFCAALDTGRRINIMVTNRVSWYKPLIKLPAGRADALKLQGGRGMPIGGQYI